MGGILAVEYHHIISMSIKSVSNSMDGCAPLVKFFLQ